MLKVKKVFTFLFITLPLFIALFSTFSYAKESQSLDIVQVTECNDGIDNDGDGYIDYAFDMGCYGPFDTSEIVSNRDLEDGWTTFDKSTTTSIYYVSSEGDDNNSGLSPQNSLATFTKARSMISKSKSAWILFKRGDIFNFGIDLTGINGESRENPVVISAYGKSHSRPIFYGKISAVKSGSNIAIIGLHSKLDEPTIENNHTTGLRFVGSFENILLEDNRFEYGQLTFQKFGDNAELNNISIRRNIIFNSFSMNSHAQGLFVKGANKLLISENFFDHNGWIIESEAKGRGHEYGQATVYNHNMYISGSHNITIHGNLIFRASSMGIKMRSDKPRQSSNISIKNNIFYEGEIGIGIGGNTTEKYRFENVEIERNAFLSIGKSQPTSRNISWPIAAKDISGLLVSNNIFAHQENHKNSFAFKMSNSIKDARILNNTVYGVNESGFVLHNEKWDKVSVSGNIIHDSQQSLSKGVELLGGLDGVSFLGNEIALRRKKNGWFKDQLLYIKGLINQSHSYIEYTGNGVSSVESINFVAPKRNLQSYFKQFDHFTDDEALMNIIASHRSRFNWSENHTAEAILNYIYKGFEVTDKKTELTAH